MLYKRLHGERFTIVDNEHIAAANTTFISDELVFNADEGEIRLGPGNWDACRPLLGGAVAALSEGDANYRFRSYTGNTDVNGQVTMNLVELLGTTPAEALLVSAVSLGQSVPMVPALYSDDPEAFVVGFTDPDNGVPADVPVRITIAWK